MHQSYRAKCIHVFPSIASRIYMTFSSVILQTSYLYINTRYQNSYTETMYSHFALDIYIRLFYRKFHSLLSIKYIWISLWNNDHTLVRTTSSSSKNNVWLWTYCLLPIPVSIIHLSLLPVFLL